MEEKGNDFIAMSAMSAMSATRGMTYTRAYQQQ